MPQSECQINMRVKEIGSREFNDNLRGFDAKCVYFVDLWWLLNFYIALLFFMLKTKF